MPEADLEDLVQEATIRVALRTNLDPTRVRGLLMHIVRQRSIDLHRRRHRETLMREGLGVMSLAKAWSEAPEALVESEEQVAAVQAAIRQLSRRERQVVALQVAGLSIRETAACLGVSAKTVEGALTRARVRLRALLRR